MVSVGFVSLVATSFEKSFWIFFLIFICFPGKIELSDFLLSTYFFSYFSKSCSKLKACMTVIILFRQLTYLYFDKVFIFCLFCLAHNTKGLFNAGIVFPDYFSEIKFFDFEKKNIFKYLFLISISISFSIHLLVIICLRCIASGAKFRVASV